MDILFETTTSMELERELVGFCFVPGLKVWLTGLADRPLLNGEQCEILEDGSCAWRTHFLVRRICSQETLVVPRENLTEDAPDGTGACLRVHAVLTRGLGRDLAARIMGFLTCPRCYWPSSPDVRCEHPHAVAHRWYLGNSRVGCEGQYFDENFVCRLCQSEFRLDLVSDENGALMLERKERKDCFQGEHSLLLPPGGEADATRTRRCIPPDVDLDELLYSDGHDLEYKKYAYPHSRIYSELQSVLDGLPSYVESINLSDNYDGAPHGIDTIRGSLANIALPKLRSIDLEFEARDCTLVLSPELTPNLERLSLESKAGLTEISVTGTGIFSAMEYLGFSGLVVGDWIHGLLAAATRLKSVQLRDLRLPGNVPKIEFASCALREIILGEIQSVEEVCVLHAPNIRSINLGSSQE